jgi:hypothetical protein
MAYDLAEVALGFKNTAAVHLRIIMPPCQCFTRRSTSRRRLNRFSIKLAEDSTRARVLRQMAAHYPWAIAMM